MSARRRILQRALRTLAAHLVALGIAAAASPNSRELLGDSPWAAAIIAGVTAALVAADKALRDSRGRRAS